MLNLFCMDIYHLFHRKAFYITFAILIFVNATCFSILYALMNPAIREFLLQHGAVITGSASEIKQSLGELTILGLFHQAAAGAGMLAVSTGIVNSLFLCIDFESGFIKNIVSAHESKWDYILSKIGMLCFTNFIYLTGTFIFTWLLNLICGSYFRPSALMDVLFYMLSAWMLCNGFSALILLICMIFRNKAVGVGAAICINSGLIVTMISSLLSLFGLQWIFDFTLYVNLASLPTSFEGTFTWMPFLIGLFFLIFYTILSKIVLTKQDI